MQGHRTTVESLPETFEFDLGSTSGNSVMVDSQVYWNNVLNNQNMVDYFLSPDEENMPPYAHAVNPDSGDGSSWNFSDPSSSGHTIVNQSDLNETKLEHQWTSSLSPGLHQSRTVNCGMPILENMDINLGGIWNTSEQVPSNNLDSNILQNSGSNNAFQNPDHNAIFVGSSGLALGGCIYSDSRDCGSDAGYLPSGNNSAIPCGTSSGDIVTGDGDGRSSASFDGRRLSCKRKSIGVPGHCSDGASSSYFDQSESNSVQISLSHPNLATGLNISRSSNNLSVATPTEALNQRVGSGMSGAGSECYTFSRSAGNAESLHRNVRMRIVPSDQHNVPLLNSQPANNSLRLRHIWPHPPPLPTSFYQTGSAVASASSHTLSHSPVIPGFPWCVHPSSWNARLSSSSTSPVISGESFIAPREETDPRNLSRNGTFEPPIFFPGNAVHLAQDPINWSLSSGTASLHGNTASSQGSGSSIDIPVSSNLLHNRNPSSHYQLSLERVRRSITSAGSNSAGQGNNTQSQRGGPSASLQTMAPNRGTRIRGQQLPLLRSASQLERQNDAVTGDSFSQRMAAAREWRSRFISEQIRNVLGLLRRGEDSRFEDLILDQAVFLGAADLHDRHRDMRLDVDNMSYEELLALEERIGNVSTGLSEETILKCLKQWKYLPPLAEASPEVEPCCICQEEYAEGEDMGTLDCGHDFHTMCIKQWLKQKNLCPICKTAALVT